MAKTATASLLDPVLDPQPEPNATERLYVILRTPQALAVQSVFDDVYGPGYCDVEHTHVLCDPPRLEPGSEYVVTGHALDWYMQKSERRRFLTAFALRFPLDARVLQTGETPDRSRGVWVLEGNISEDDLPGKGRPGWEFYAATEACGFCEIPENLP